MSAVLELAKRAKKASSQLALTSAAQRNRALTMMADALRSEMPSILAENTADLEAARARGTAEGLLDRLALDQHRVEAIAAALENLRALPDPIGEVVSGYTLYNGIEMTQVRVPLGVVGMIYEARPNVTADAAGLCVKTGNAVILRGGSLAHRSNLELTRVLAEAATAAGMPENSIQAIQTTDHESAEELMGLHDYVDVLIPRGGAGLIRSVVDKAKVPVIETGIGNCHVYVHESADLEMASRIVVNAKTQRPSVCNAAESLLVDEAIADQLLPSLLAVLLSKGVKLRADERSLSLGLEGDIEPATEDDWGTEYHELMMSVKVVSGLDDAIDHVNRYGTKHSEAIVCKDYDASRRFLHEVDAAAVYVNASTRFTDGGEFGLGAEIGISTQKLHARGPMGLLALTSTKFMLMGDGQIRE